MQRDKDTDGYNIDLLRLWALLDELEETIRISPFSELMAAILNTHRKVVAMMERQSTTRS